MAKTTVTDTSASKGIMSRLTLGTLVNNISTHSLGGIIGTLLSDHIAPFFLGGFIGSAIRKGKESKEKAASVAGGED